MAALPLYRLRLLPAILLFSVCRVLGNDGACTSSQRDEHHANRARVLLLDGAMGLSTPQAVGWLAGNWSYKSYANTANQDLFGAGIFMFSYVSGSNVSVTGQLDMGSGLFLDLTGNASAVSTGDVSSLVQVVELIGLGRDNTATQGWRYDYHGSSAYVWSNGVNQTAALLGSVIRVYAHGPLSPAGEVASFVAVALSAAPPSNLRSAAARLLVPDAGLTLPALVCFMISALIG